MTVFDRLVDAAGLGEYTDSTRSADLLYLPDFRNFYIPLRRIAAVSETEREQADAK